MQRSRPPYARPPVWPAYLVAAVCFALAIATTLNSLALTSQVRQLQSEIARSDDRVMMYARALAIARTTLADLQSPQAQRFGSGNDQVVSSNGRLYLLMRGLSMPPRGRVYQAWIVARNATSMTPSVTFIPDPHGVAVVALADADAARTREVAVSTEPEGGSRAPTGRLVLDVSLL